MAASPKPSSISWQGSPYTCMHTAYTIYIIIFIACRYGKVTALTIEV